MNPSNIDKAKEVLRKAETALESVIKENDSLRTEMRQLEREFVHDIKNLIMPVSSYMQLIEAGAMEAGMVCRCFAHVDDPVVLSLNGKE